MLEDRLRLLARFEAGVLYTLCQARRTAAEDAHLANLFNAIKPYYNFRISNQTFV